VNGVTFCGMHRGITLAVPGVALATAGGLLAQVHHTANAPLPHFGDLDVTGTYGSHGATTVRVTVLGDSSMTGPGLECGGHVWIAQLADALPWQVELIGRAKGGSRVRDVLENQLPDAVDDEPDLFVVSVGANAATHGTSRRVYAERLARVFDELSEVAPVVSLGIGDLSIIPRLPLSLRPLLTHRSRVMDRAHAVVSADRGRVSRIPVGELSDPHFRRRRHELFADDLFHPNRQGHRLWAELFRPAVFSALLGVGSSSVATPSSAEQS